MTMPRFATAAMLALGLAMAASPAVAQPSATLPRIGYLGAGGANVSIHAGFRDALRELGWIEGQNVVVDYRLADGRYARLPEYAAELVRRKVDVIVAGPTPAALAAKHATATVPIVMFSVGDPVGAGLVASLARPAGNVTGTTFDVGLETFTKGLELLKDTIPNLRSVAVLTNPGNPGQKIALHDLKAAAQLLGLQLTIVETRQPDDFPAVFAKLAKEPPDALFIVIDPMFLLHRTQLAELALRHRLPTMHGVRESVEAGGLLSYGPRLADGPRRAAVFVDRILKGAKAGDLPVEQPTRFELVANLRTAKLLGLAIPSAVLVRADEVIR